jgi:DNA-binding NarL/FixJ family response regulator
MQNRVRVLVADDDPLYAQSVALALALDDRIDVVAIARNGAEATELCAWQRPDVVLMDLHMPGVDGIEATRRIKAATPASRILMVTASEDPDAMERSRAAGATRFLPKSASLEAVREAVLDLYCQIIPLPGAAA